LKVSVLICTLNEELNIFDRISNLKSLILPNFVQFEIHVLDNGSTDKTCARVLSFPSNENIFLHQLDPIGKCGALFWAFENIPSDYYLLTDANTIFEASAIVNLVMGIKLNPNKGVYVGNFRSVRSKDQGDLFFLGLQKMPLRIAIENFLGIFTGANGGCYCVSKNSIKNIWHTQAVRNDDFIISVYCASKQGVVFLENVKACEIENLTNSEIFKQKYRDALGHYQAMRWIYSNIECIFSRITILLFRFFLWFTPLLILLYLLLFHPYLLLIAISISSLSAKTRRIVLRLFSLYAGFFIGILKSPKTSWTPIR
jgi:glycosyltransferase involved in cell wall biosynthesis